jgi:hypothetical protein
MGLDDIDPVARDPMFIKDAGDKNERHKDILVFRGRISAKTVKTIQSQVILDQEFFSNIKKTFADARAAKKDAYKTYMNKTTVNYSALSVKLAQNAKQLEKFNIKIENLTNLKAEHAQELKTRVEIDNVVADILALEKNSDPAVEQLNEAIKDDVEAIKEHSRVYMENMNNILNVSTERINDILEGVAVVCRETQDQMDAVVNISEN